MVLTVLNPETKKVSSSETATRIVLIVEYDGTCYYGFQLQASLPTIQGEIESALGRLTGDRIRISAASRTDTGVHAKRQVISFRTGSSLPLTTFIKGLNYYLPSDIAIKAAYKAEDSFNVRRAARSREYNYYILNSPTPSPMRAGFTYQVREPLDIEAINQACQMLVGEHDFASFASAMGAEIRNTVRRVYKAGMEKEGDLVAFNIVASSFLPHQVRNTVGSLIRIGLGKMSAGELYEIMEARKPGLAGPSVPASGLCLMQVNYAHPFEREV